MPKHYTIKTVHTPLKGNKLLPWGIFGGLFCLILIGPIYTVEGLSAIFLLTLLAGFALDFRPMRILFQLIHILLIIFYIVAFIYRNYFIIIKLSFFYSASDAASALNFFNLKLLSLLVYSAMNLFLFSRFLKKQRQNKL